MINKSVKQSASSSVLCWLASCDSKGQPNVSPKEIFTIYDESTLLVAHIASPRTVLNIQSNPQVCVSFINIFTQKGYKIYGDAHIITPSHQQYAHYLAPLKTLAGDKFTIQAIIHIHIKSYEAIIAPSYRFYSHQTTEAAMIESAHKTYMVRCRDNLTKE